MTIKNKEVFLGYNVFIIIIKNEKAFLTYSCLS